MTHAPGDPFPDLQLPDHAGNARRLSELVAGDPTVLHCYRGWWCPGADAATSVRTLAGEPAGASARVSLVLPPAGVRLAFDDLAVQQARRELLAREPFDAVSTLLTDDSHFEGSILVARGEDVGRLRDDPLRTRLPRPCAPRRRRSARPRPVAGRPGDRALRQRATVAGGPLRLSAVTSRC